MMIYLKLIRYLLVLTQFFNKAINNNCLTYSWHKEDTKFKVSNYVNDMIELERLKILNGNKNYHNRAGRVAGMIIQTQRKF